ncbi:hypothetical protein ACWEQC_00475 [Streptomyces shenzhenensis]
MLPEGIPVVRVTGRFLTPAGKPLSGQVVFRSPMLVFSDFDVILGGPVTATLDATGAIDVMLPATDAPGMNPAGWSYSVAEQLATVPMNRVYQVLLPAADPTVDLADIAPTDPSTPTYVAVRGDSAYEIAVKEGFDGSIEQWLASLVGPQGTDGAPGIVQSVNGKSTTAVVLTAADVAAVATSGNNRVDGTLTVNYAGTQNDVFKATDAGQSRYTAINKNAELITNVPATFTDARVGGSNATLGGGAGVLAFANAVTAPSSNPSGAVMYAESGRLRVRQADGTLFALAAAPVTSVNDKTGAVALAAADVGALATTARGAADGVASLDSTGRIPVAQAPAAAPRNVWTPQALGFAAWSLDPGGVANPAAKYLTPQRLYLTGINITEDTTVTKAVLFARGYGGVTSNRYMSGIYRENGTRVVASSAVALTMAGQETGALPAMASNHIGAVPIPFASTTLTPGRYWVAWLMTVGSASDFSFFHVQNESPVATANFFMTTTPFPRAWYISAQSTLPTTVNPAASTALADHDIPILALAA